jgi:hypothetical protein
MGSPRFPPAEKDKTEETVQRTVSRGERRELRRAAGSRRAFVRRPIGPAQEVPGTAILGFLLGGVLVAVVGFFMWDNYKSHAGTNPTTVVVEKK